MPEFPGEVAGLPDGGPATLPAVKALLGIPAEDLTEDARLTLTINTVNAQIRTWPTAERSADSETWWPPTIEGAARLVARIDSRRNSTDGADVTGTELPVYVQLNDPEIAMQLEIGDWAKPAAG